MDSGDFEGGDPKALPPDGGADLARFLILVWTRRFWVGGCTAFFTAVGLAYALLSIPVYETQAIISLKESEKGGDPSRIFSQLGGLGGMVASQFGMGSASLEKVEILLKGHEMAEAVIRKNNLMPLLFSGRWNGDSLRTVRDRRAGPTIWDGIGVLRKRILSVTLDPKKKTVTVGARFRDPEAARDIVDWYLEALNNRIRNDVITDAETNRRYLEEQLGRTSDPMLMEKIQSMIAMEMEKYMLVNSRAFDVLEKAVVPEKRSKPKRVQILALSLILGFFVSGAGIFLAGVADDFRKAFKNARESAPERNDSIPPNAKDAGKVV